MAIGSASLPAQTERSNNFAPLPVLPGGAAAVPVPARLACWKAIAPVPVGAGGNARVPEAADPDRRNEIDPVPVRLGGGVTVTVSASNDTASRVDPTRVRPGARCCRQRNRFSMDDYTLEAVNLKTVTLMTPPITMDTLSSIAPLFCRS